MLRVCIERARGAAVGLKADAAWAAVLFRLGVAVLVVSTVAGILAAASAVGARASRPSIESESVSDITLTDAVLEAQINPGGLETTYEPHLVSSPRCREATPPCEIAQYVPPLPSGKLPAAATGQKVSLDLNSAGVKLSANERYEYWVTATNADGTVQGQHQRFTTLAPPTNEHQEEEAVAKKHREEEESAAKKRQQQEAARKHEEQEAAAKKHREEQAAAKKYRKEAALRKRQEQKAAAKKRREEAAAKKRQEKQAAAKKPRPKITWRIPTNPRVGRSTTVEARSTSRAGAELSSATPSICALTPITSEEQPAGVSLAKARLLRAGRCIVIARLKATAEYKAAEARASFRVLARKQGQAVRKVLSGEGIGRAHFGESRVIVVRRIEMLLGRRPSQGYRVARRGGGVDHEIQWPGLALFFARGRFIGYECGRRTHPAHEPVLATGKGLRVGQRVAVGERLYRTAFRLSAQQGGAWFAKTPQGRLLGYTSDVANPKGRILTIDAGHVGGAALTP